MTKADYSNKCSSILHDALSVQKLALETTGELREMVESLYKAGATKNCKGSGAEAGNSIQKIDIGITAMIGPIFIHGMGLVVAVIAYFFARARSDVATLSRDSHAVNDDKVK